MEERTWGEKGLRRLSFFFSPLITQQIFRGLFFYIEKYGFNQLSEDLSASHQELIFLEVAIFQWQALG